MIKEWAALVYNLENAIREEALSSLIIQSDSACTTCLIWLSVGAAIVKRVLTGAEAAGSAQRAWIRHWAAQVSSASVSRLHIKIWRV